MKSTKKGGNSATLLISCPDQRGLVAAISQFLLEHRANILHADQHLDAETNLFLMRVEWDLTDFNLGRQPFEKAFEPLVQKHQLKWSLAYSENLVRMAIFVSHYDHCLADLLYRHRSGEIRCEIPLIISNHSESASLAEFYGIPFFEVPMTPEKKAEAEAVQLQLLREYRIDLVILARYMQIVPPQFVREYPNRMINIHHSFLPAFLGAKPYHRAFARGVKLIGATSHYVTDTLDEGPIIEQDVIRVSHRDSVEDLVQKGRDLEKIILSRAVRWHLENRILVYGNKTVVFE